MNLLVVFLLACSGKEEAECASDDACGFGEVCLEGQCKGRSCATSAQCGMEQYCLSGECKNGCEVDADCYPGDACDTTSSTVGSCATAACTSSRIDCEFNQFCNSVTGECYDAGGYYCKSCNDDSDCGGSGNYCLNLGYAESDFCGVTCSTDSDCPSGYTCSPLGDLSGNIIAYQCLTYCWLYEEEGARRTSLPPIVPTRSGR